MNFAPDHITALGPDEIIVVGTNTAGRHGAGAAAYARRKFGLVYGIGEGLSGQTYALPTLGKKLEQRNDEQLTMSVRRLWKAARENPTKTFLLTKVGCGLAGYDEAYIALKFKGAPDNILLPKGWNR